MSRPGDESTGLQGELKKVGKHSFVYAVGQGLSRAVGFLMIPVYTRFIAPSDYGTMELIEIVCTALAVSIAMGAAHGMWRFYYEQKEEAQRNEVVSTILQGLAVIGLPLVIGSVLLAGVVSRHVIGDTSAELPAQVALLAIWFGVLCDIGFSYLRMLYMAKTFVAVTTLQLVAALSLNVFFVVGLRIGILGIFLSVLITQSLVGLGLAVWILRRVGTRFSLPLFKKILAFGLPLVPPRLGTMFAFVSNRFFLRWLSSPDPAVALASVGLFSLGHKFGVIVHRFVGIPLNSFWGPRRMELLLDGEADHSATVARVCTYSAFVSISLALLIAAGAESVIRIMAAPEYHGSHVVVPVVAGAYVLVGLEQHFRAGLLIKKKTSRATVASLVALPVVLVWNALFVPRFGLMGAATALLAGSTTTLVIVYVSSQRLYRIPFELGRLSVMGAVAIALFGCTRLVAFEAPLLTLGARLGIASAFPVLLLLLGMAHADEMRAIKSLVRRGLPT